MLPDLPNALWTAGTGDQVIPKSAFRKIEGALLEAFELISAPRLIWVDNATCRVQATADSLARAMLCGFPNLLNPGHFLTAGLTDGRYRENTANVSCNFGLGGALWGAEKASQWYAIFATAANTDASFGLQAMPYLRVKSQAGQVISLGTNPTPATGIGYGFTTDQFAAAKIYVLTGASAGLLRIITNNNNDNSTGGTLTYSGAALTLAQGDYFIILPATNFRRLGDVFNNASSNFTQIDDLIFGQAPYEFMSPGTFTWTCPLTWDAALATGSGGGAGAAISGGSAVTAGGGAGALGFKVPVAPSPGTIYTITVGAKGLAGVSPTPGGNTSLGPLLTLAGGAINIVPGFSVVDYNDIVQGIGGLGQAGFGPYGKGGNGGFNGTPASTDGTDGFFIIERAV